MKAIRILILLALAVTMILTGCDKDSATDPNLNSDVGGILERVSTSSGPGQRGQEREALPMFLLEGPGPFFFWALDLTEEQQQQLQEIGQKYMESMRPPGQGGQPGSPPDENEKALHDSLRQVMHDEMVEILSEDQKAVLAEIETQLEDGEYPEIATQKRVEFLTEKLGLTVDQQNQARDLLKQFGTRLIEIRKSTQDKRESREAVGELLKELDQKFVDLLDEGQKSLYETLKVEFRPKNGPGGHGPTN